ncbi:NDR1/HIN1-like protein 1 [Oryza brachyantha]|uniref:Late embryogenesis abundant protein LEA-2 subgroup domain-containing protein n=1 Tax=Oryza brachyantha TaxID=4533 RepID=J3N670_ORYBR|nr:NDR1/HIN1-like protein 1 [Oryza brachyantha]
MSKDCGNHGDDDVRQACRRLLAVLLGLAFVVAIIALIVYLVLRPTHPRFFLQDATLRQLDGSNASALLSTSIQVTLASRNPNDRVGVYYDRLDVYASYKYQQITLAASLPPVYQGHGDVDVWSPVLAGPNVPFAPYLGDALAKDLASGYLILQVKVDGRVRWKVGSWISGHYHLFVTCPAFFITSGGNGYPGASGLKFQTATYCRVEV